MPASRITSHRILVAITVILGVILVVSVFFSHRGLYQVYRLHQERLRLDQENACLAEDNARMARTIDRLQHDPEMIQELIRRELNFVKKNEIIFQLSPGQHQSTASPAPPGGGPPAEPLAEAEPLPNAGNTGWTWDSLEGAPKPRSRPSR
jgi:cell division protein FtsB